MKLKWLCKGSVAIERGAYHRAKLVMQGFRNNENLQNPKQPEKLEKPV